MMSVSCELKGGVSLPSSLSRSGLDTKLVFDCTLKIPGSSSWPTAEQILLRWIGTNIS